MKQITLEIEDTKFDALVKFLKTLDYVRVSKGSFTINDFQNSLNQVKQIKEGKLPKRNIEQLLNGISN